MDAMLRVQILRAACCVAGSDGIANEQERRIVETLAAEVGVGEASLAAMIQRAETEDDYVNDHFRVLKSDPKETMGALFAVALADDLLTDTELNVLQRLSERLDVPAEQYEQWLGQARATVENPES